MFLAISPISVQGVYYVCADYNQTEAYFTGSLPSAEIGSFDFNDVHVRANATKLAPTTNGGTSNASTFYSISL